MSINYVLPRNNPGFKELSGIGFTLYKLVDSFAGIGETINEKASEVEVQQLGVAVGCLTDNLASIANALSQNQLGETPETSEAVVSPKAANPTGQEAIPEHRDIRNPIKYVGVSKYENGAFSTEIPSKVAEARMDYACECLFKIEAIKTFAHSLEKSLESEACAVFADGQMVHTIGIAIYELASQLTTGYSVMLEEYYVRLPEKEVSHA